MTQVDRSFAGSGQEALHRGGAWRWWMAGVLFLATLLTYLDRQTLSICEHQICTEFHLNDEDYGYLVAAFRWSYALMQVPAGMMADHLPLRTTFGLAVGLWSLAGAAAAYVFRLPMLMVARGVLGMGECFNWPCSSRIVANTFPPRDRSLASGIFNGGAALGSLIAPVVIGGLAEAYGWRRAFLFIGSAGIAWLVIWFAATARFSPCHAAVRFDAKFSLRWQLWFAAAFLLIGILVPAGVILLGPRIIEPLTPVFHAALNAIPYPRPTIVSGIGLAVLVALGWSLAKWRSRAVAFWMLLIVSATVHPCWYFMNEWLIKALREDRHLDQWKFHGFALTLVVLTVIMLVSDLGNLAGGSVIKYLVHRGRSLRTARAAAMIGAGCLIAPVALVNYVSNLPLATILFGLAGLGLTSIIAAHTACQQDYSFQRVGVISGLVGLTANVVYALASPAIGRHHDQTHSYQLLFVLLGTLPLLGIAAILIFDALIHGRARRHS